MQLKFWAWIYRTTGYYSDYALAREYEVVEVEMKKLMKKKNLSKSRICFRISIVIGTWQATHGFYRQFNF